MIETTWFTDRLKIADTLDKDLPALERVLSLNAPTLLLDGIGNPDSTELCKWLTEGDLPPDGKRERYRLQTISQISDNKILGYLGLYHGFPDNNTLYISSLCIRPDCQRSGFGGEVADTIQKLDGLRAYPTHRLVVTVKNWGAVRFWTRHGFTKIVTVIGELENCSHTARLELEREQDSAVTVS